MSDAAEEMLTVEQVSTYLKISPTTLAYWRTRRIGIPFVKVGSAVRYRRSDLEAWLEKNTSGHA